ncbi:hly [Symbiodinium microadriaticum]|nr:hly [Symbiodinium microadriaticum]
MILAATALLSFVLCAQGADNFLSFSSNGHAALKSSTHKSNKWLLFPDQKDYHQKVRGSNSKHGIDLKDIVHHDDSFWKNHGTDLGLHDDAIMRLSQHTRSSHTSNKKYEQYLADVRVFGGEYRVTVGAHDGVVHAHGKPLELTSELSSHNVETIKQAPINTDDLLASVKSHMTSSRPFAHVSVSAVRFTSPVELVWHSTKGYPSLAYLASGAAAVNADTPLAAGLVFEVLVSATTGDVEWFVDKTGAVEDSPFASPIDDAAIYVYDQYLKDYNDDHIYDDDYYDQDPDKYSNATLVFDTTSGEYTYPTEDQELNYLVDNTLYIKYMYNSLSDGDYLTWNRTETDWNIEYNLSIANAYFDGTWGIHFGTGYITDDVVPHEWSHGYTQTGCGLIYAFESGAMNEAFSDIFGESIDILNMDTSDPDVHRTAWPTTCHETLNSAYGVPPGSDTGTRWSMGENVTTNYSNSDGSIRDMYRPECFIHPGDVLSDYYSCTTYADNGGVHKNSGVLNRLYSVLVDGGEYEDQDTGGANLVVHGLGFVKATNLFWRTHQELVSTSQFADLAIALQQVCDLNIGADLFFPNVFNATITVSDEKLTAMDCANVTVAIQGSGMGREEDYCPNIYCASQYDCEWANCPDSNTELFYEDYDYYMGYGGNGTMLPACPDAESTFVRVFDQDSFPELNGMELFCVQFGYWMMGSTPTSVAVYIDSDGGDPDAANLQLLYNFPVTTVNAVGQMQVQTVTADESITLDFANALQTLVVVMTVPVMDEGLMMGAGQFNGDVVGTSGETYIGGECRTGFVPYSTFATDNGENPYDAATQWYVRLHATTTVRKNSNDDDNSLSTGAIIGISIAAAVVVLGIVGVIARMFYCKKKPDSGIPLIS